MIRIASIACAFLALALSACSTVSTVEPFGLETAELDPEDWVGTWEAMDDCEPCEITLVAVEKGILRGAWTEVEDGEKKPQTVDLHFREVNQSLFVSFMDDEPEEEGGETPYYWAKIQLREDGDNENPVLLAWLPDAAKFKALVDAGKLPGTAVKGDYTTDVRLGKLTAAHCELIASEEEGVLFLWTEPLLYRRIAHD